MLVPRSPKQSYDVRELCERGRKTAVVIGGSCKLGVSVVHELVQNGYQVIVASRQISRFLDSGCKASWVYVDTRIPSTLINAFTQITQECGRIDVVVNLAHLNGKYEMHTLSGERNGDDIHLKLTDAYKPNSESNLHLYRRGSPGVESWIFTNIIGLINVIEVCFQFDVGKVVLLKSDNHIVKGILEETRIRLKDRVVVASPENVQGVVSEL